MTESTRETVRGALFEAAFVVLGVILALAANEWRQGRAETRESQQALASILEELRNNRAAVASSLEYHQELMQLLRGNHEDGWAPEPRQFHRGFVSPAQTSRAAWDSAGETGARSRIEFQLVQELSNTYEQQERYESQALVVGEILYTAIFQGGTESIGRNYRNLASVIGAFLYKEAQLLTVYDQAIEAAESGLRP